MKNRLHLRGIRKAVPINEWRKGEIRKERYLEAESLIIFFFFKFCRSFVWQKSCVNYCLWKISPKWLPIPREENCGLLEYRLKCANFFLFDQRGNSYENWWESVSRYLLPSWGLPEERCVSGDAAGLFFRPNAKRRYKNQKFGFGGKKKGSKWNTKDSFNDVSSFRSKVAHNKGPGKGGKKALNVSKMMSASDWCWLGSPPWSGRDTWVCD